VPIPQFKATAKLEAFLETTSLTAAQMVKPS
jgi:hypothetical protein